MPLIQYGQDIYKELGNHTSTRKATTFNNWQLTKFKFKNKKYYLFVEIETGLAIVTQKIEQNEFNHVLVAVTGTMDYLLPEQREELTDIIFNIPFTLAHNDLIKCETTDKMLNYLKHNSEDLEGRANFDDPYLSDFDKLVILSLTLMTSSPEHAHRTIEKIAQKVNKFLPVKPARPNKKVKYWDLERQFDDPAKWEEYEGQNLDSNSKISKEIKRNNDKIIDQYLNSTNIYYPYYLIDPNPHLEDFLNNYLFVDGLRFVNSNLGDVSYYSWWLVNQGLQINENLPQEQKNQIVNELFIMFTDFYLFLSRVGLIRQSDARKVKNYCKKQWENYVISELDNDDDENIDSSFNKLENEIMEHPEKLLAIAQDKNTPPDVANYIEQMVKLLVPNNNLTKSQNIKYEDKKRNSATYEIRTKLRGFHPSTWRRFIISGNSSVTILMRAILFIFNVDWGHLYDLYNPANDIRYENQDTIEAMSEWKSEDAVNAEKVKVSAFEQGDKLILSYDYGDGWEFEVNIKKVDDYARAPKYPRILSGKGLGIIDDIGGVGSLQDYYDTPEDQLDPDIIDWTGGEKIDLDKFDKDGLNDGLMHLDD